MEVSSESESETESSTESDSECSDDGKSKVNVKSLKDYTINIY